MKFLRDAIFYACLVGAIGFAGWVYLEKKPSCDKPVKYSLGSIDSRFGMSKDEVKRVAEEATHIWEDSYGKNLFDLVESRTPNRFEKYFTRTPVVVSFIYDERQATRDANKGLLSQINESKEDLGAARAELTRLEGRYKAARAEYLSLLEQYKKRRVEFDVLEAKRLEVNGLADDINALVKKHNSLVEYVNARVEVINQNVGQEFEEGEYTSDKLGEEINIYEFDSRTALLRVLAHEFGHALGLDHNDNEQSIMHYLNSSTNLKPTKEDLAALREVCATR